MRTFDKISPLSGVEIDGCDEGFLNAPGPSREQHSIPARQNFGPAMADFASLAVQCGEYVGLATPRRYSHESRSACRGEDDRILWSPGCSVRENGNFRNIDRWLPRKPYPFELALGKEPDPASIRGEKRTVGKLGVDHRRWGYLIEGAQEELPYPIHPADEDEALAAGRKGHLSCAALNEPRDLGRRHRSQPSQNGHGADNKRGTPGNGRVPDSRRPHPGSFTWWLSGARVLLLRVFDLDAGICDVVHAASGFFPQATTQQP